MESINTKMSYCNSLVDLPSNLLWEITSYLNPRDFCNLELTSKPMFCSINDLSCITVIAQRNIVLLIHFIKLHIKEAGNRKKIELVDSKCYGLTNKGMINDLISLLSKKKFFSELDGAQKKVPEVFTVAIRNGKLDVNWRSVLKDNPSFAGNKKVVLALIEAGLAQGGFYNSLNSELQNDSDVFAATVRNRVLGKEWYPVIEANPSFADNKKVILALIEAGLAKSSFYNDLKAELQNDPEVLSAAIQAKVNIRYDRIIAFLNDKAKKKSKNLILFVINDLSWLPLELSTWVDSSMLSDPDINEAYQRQLAAKLNIS